MTQPELILKLIEQLITEKEKNIKLQSQLEEYKKGKDKCVIHSRSGEICYRVSSLFLSIKKVDVVTDTSTINNIHKPDYGTIYNSSSSVSFGLNLSNVPIICNEFLSILSINCFISSGVFPTYFFSLLEYR